MFRTNAIPAEPARGCCERTIRRSVCYRFRMIRTYTFVFDPDPDGGFVVTCPALPGLVTHGDTIEKAREMAQDAADGYLATLIEDGGQLSSRAHAAR